MTVSGESLTEMRLQEKKTLENVLINDCWEALGTMLAASQSAAIKLHFFQSFHKWQQWCKHHIMLFVFQTQSAAVAKCWLCWSSVGLEANAAALIHQAFVTESPCLSSTGFYTILREQTWMILFKNLKTELEHTESCVWCVGFYIPGGSTHTNAKTLIKVRWSF